MVFGRIATRVSLRLMYPAIRFIRLSISRDWPWAILRILLSTNTLKKIFREVFFPYFCTPDKRRGSSLKIDRSQKSISAEVAQLVERNLAKVEVAGSSLV